MSNAVASITAGNPTLLPEHSVTVDGGLALSLPRHGLALDVTDFATDVDDRISIARATFAAGRRPTTADGRQIGSVTTSASAGDARLRGVEVEARHDVGRAMRRAFSLSAGGSTATSPTPPTRATSRTRHSSCST